MAGRQQRGDVDHGHLEQIHAGSPVSATSDPHDSLTVAACSQYALAIVTSTWTYGGWTPRPAEDVGVLLPTPK
jgi:hypothetical protein